MNEIGLWCSVFLTSCQGATLLTTLYTTYLKAMNKSDWAFNLSDEVLCVSIGLASWIHFYLRMQS